MRHYDILFDRGAQKIHFTRSNCSDQYQGPYFTDQVGFETQSSKRFFLLISIWGLRFNSIAFAN